MSTPLGPQHIQKVSRMLDSRFPADHYPNLTPTSLDQAWGVGPNEVLDHYVHPTAVGSRGVIAMFHFGGGTKGDHRQPAMAASGAQNALAYHVLKSPDASLYEYDVLSVNYEQFRWDDPTPVTHIAAYSHTNNPTLWPTNQACIGAFFSWLLANAGANNWDTSRIHVLGSSHGGVLVSLESLANGLPIQSIVIESPIPDYRDPLISWPVAEGMYGDGSQAAWDARADADKEAITQLLYGLGPTTTPYYVVNAANGNGSTPYGAVAGGSIHDQAQWHAFTEALTTAGAPWDGEICPRGAWQSPKLGVAISRRALDFMQAQE